MNGWVAGVTCKGTKSDKETIHSGRCFWHLTPRLACGRRDAISPGREGGGRPHSHFWVFLGARVSNYRLLVPSVSHSLLCTLTPRAFSSLSSSLLTCCPLMSALSSCLYHSQSQSCQSQMTSCLYVNFFSFLFLEEFLMGSGFQTLLTLPFPSPLPHRRVLGPTWLHEAILCKVAFTATLLAGSVQDSLKGDPLPSVILEGLPLPLFLLSDNIVGIKVLPSPLVDNLHGEA